MVYAAASTLGRNRCVSIFLLFWIRICFVRSRGRTHQPKRPSERSPVRCQKYVSVEFKVKMKVVQEKLKKTFWSEPFGGWSRRTCLAFDRLLPKTQTVPNSSVHILIPIRRRMGACLAMFF